MKCPTCHRDYPKTNKQRNYWHGMCRELGLHIGLTPAKVKEAIKIDYFGIDEYKVGNKLYRAVRPSELADRAEYSALIEYTKVWAAENCDYIFED